MIQRITPHLVLFFAFFCWCGVSQAGGGPENLVLVVNADSQTSKLIANYYIQLRDISPRNVIYLGSVPKEEVTSFARFKNRILIPIVKQIQLKGLGEQIDYVVYSADFPTAVKIGEEVTELRGSSNKTAPRSSTGNFLDQSPPLMRSPISCGR